MIGKREKTAGCLPLVRGAAAQAAFPPAKGWHPPCARIGAPRPTPSEDSKGAPPYRDWQGSKLLPSLQRAGERHLVHKFQMPADRDAVRQAGDLDPKRLQQP